MRSILDTCIPRPELTTGTFNPEVFTASLSQVMDHYRGPKATLDSIYTEAVAFFREATFPTEGMRSVVESVFARLAGDGTVRAINRLETGFGGGKTHTLIACTHIAHRGTELAEVTGELLPPSLLPEPGSIQVVGIAGDQISVNKTKGTELRPYTLWGEIAHQVGSEALYKEVEGDAESLAAPGEAYFEKVFGGRKVLIMLDELAQYSARVQAARPGQGAGQLAAFLMTLHGYARTHSGLAIVLTLASSKDAFANETRTLQRLLGADTGENVSEAKALEIGQAALNEVSSVVSRDATITTPVQASEISRVLAKRLFSSIDEASARETAGAYGAMYARNRSLLPEEASRADYLDRITSYYPFHPSLVDFLNRKLALYEDFHGTRGTLRVLAFAVRSLWKRRLAIPAIHVCHLDLRDQPTVEEILGRTGSADLKMVLNSDIGGIDTVQLDGGTSNAEDLDRRNPHPEGFPMYEMAWKTVLLNSLVGRESGLESNIFGAYEPEALFQVAFPIQSDGSAGLTPHQVKVALEAVRENAFWLRQQDGRYYASKEPSINVALSRVRKTIGAPAVQERLDQASRKVVRDGGGFFKVQTDVTRPEHVEDKTGRPTLAVLTLGAGNISVESFITTVGPNRPRHEQNLVFLLVPSTVTVEGAELEGGDLLQAPGSNDAAIAAARALEEVSETARWVIAAAKLAGDPGAYGLTRGKLDSDPDFRARHAEREQALAVQVTQLYNSLWYPSASGKLRHKAIKTAGGEGGASHFELIRRALMEDQEIVTPELAENAQYLKEIHKLAFKGTDVTSVTDFGKGFREKRHWPVLQSPDLFERIIREGVTRGIWCLFRMPADNAEATRPAEFYARENGGVPYDANLTEAGWQLVTLQGAAMRGWTKAAGPDQKQVVSYVEEIITALEEASLSTIAEQVTEKHGDVPEEMVKKAVTDLLVNRGKVLVKKTSGGNGSSAPQVIGGSAAALLPLSENTVFITKSKAAVDGLLQEKSDDFSLDGSDGAARLLPALRRAGSLYARGGKSTIKDLDLVSLVLPQGGTLRLQLQDVSPKSMKDLGELFECLNALVKIGPETEGYLTIEDPAEDCLFLKELKEMQTQS